MAAKIFHERLISPRLADSLYQRVLGFVEDKASLIAYHPLPRQQPYPFQPQILHK
jgi:hypothetical protein